MVRIHYLEENDVKQVVEVITEIVKNGIAGDANSKQLAKYIRQGLKQLTSVGVPPNHKLQLISTEESGHLRTFQLLKKIICNKPLFEFRVNRDEPGAFRALFFEYQHQNEQLLVFTKALLKNGDINPPELQQAIQESERLYDDFHRNPDKYLLEDD